MARLIDADALKADLRRYFTDGVLDGISAKLAFNQILHDIDNAPTIETDMSEYSDKLWQKAYERGKAEGRPQGEWIIDGHHYKCSRCGKTLAIMFSETDDDDLIGCPFCLADMRGGRE